MALVLLCAGGTPTAQASALSSERSARAAERLREAIEVWNERAAIRAMAASHGPLALHESAGSASEHALSIELAHGRTVWPLNLRIPAGIHLTAVNGLLPDVPLVAYLHWRRSLDPTRFDAFHPRVGLLLARDLLLRDSSISTSSTPFPQVVPPPPLNLPPAPPEITPIVPGPPLPPTPPCPNAPEPSSGLLAAVLLASGAWASRRSRRRLA